MKEHNKTSILFNIYDEKRCDPIGYNCKNKIYILDGINFYVANVKTVAWTYHLNWEYFGCIASYETDDLGCFMAFEIPARTFYNLLTSENPSYVSFAKEMIQNLDNFFKKVRN